MFMSKLVKAASSALSLMALGVVIAETDASFSAAREEAEKEAEARLAAEKAAAQELNHLRREAAEATRLRQEVERLRRQNGGKRPHHHQPE